MRYGTNPKSSRVFALLLALLLPLVVGTPSFGDSLEVGSIECWDAEVSDLLDADDEIESRIVSVQRRSGGFDFVSPAYVSLQQRAFDPAPSPRGPPAS